MNRWYQIRRLRGAVILILIGVLALLNQWNIMHWGTSWPLILIVLGLLMVAERAVWTADVRAQQEEQQYAASMGGYHPGAADGWCTRICVVDRASALQCGLRSVCPIAALRAGRSRKRRPVAPWACLHSHRRNIRHRAPR